MSVFVRAANNVGLEELGLQKFTVFCFLYPYSGHLFWISLEKHELRIFLFTNKIKYSSPHKLLKQMLNFESILGQYNKAIESIRLEYQLLDSKSGLGTSGFSCDF